MRFRAVALAVNSHENKLQYARPGRGVLQNWIQIHESRSYPESSWWKEGSRGRYSWRWSKGVRTEDGRGGDGFMDIVEVAKSKLKLPIVRMPDGRTGLDTAVDTSMTESSTFARSSEPVSTV